jgi:hypothetical protein
MLTLLQEGAEWLNAYMARTWYIDFHGQQLAERLFQVILVIAGVIGFIYGFLTESMQVLSRIETCLWLGHWRFQFYKVASNFSKHYMFDPFDKMNKKYKFGGHVFGFHQR